MDNKYLASLLAAAGVGEGAERTAVTIPNFGKDGGDVTWHLQPFNGNEETLIEEYITRTAAISEITNDNLREAIYRVAGEISKEPVEAADEASRRAAEQEQTNRINQAALLVWAGFTNPKIDESARSAAMIYYAAKNPLGMLLFKPAEARTKTDDFAAIDQVRRLPEKLRSFIVSNYIDKHCVSPLTKAVRDGHTDQLQDEIAKKSEATPAGASQQS